MTVLRVTIRRPPRCKRCAGTGWEMNGKLNVLGNRVTCGLCAGRSAEVEYFFEYGPLAHTKAYWDVWAESASSL